MIRISGRAVVKVKVVVFLLMGVLALKGAIAAPATEKSVRELLDLTGAGNLSGVV